MSEDLLERPQVFGGYLLLRALGRGAMGDVFLARPLDPSRGLPSPIVVKRLHGELAEKPGFIARFRHEAAVAVCVDSPNVAKVYDVGAVGETLYIAMEFVHGWPLSKLLEVVLKSGRHASVASVVDLLAGGLEGLAALHEAIDTKTGRALEVVHRDISPKNLMVGEDGAMRLIDLGLGKSNAQDWRTRTGVVMGSVGYMPPEQARGERVDARADVYAMGVVAFEMLALRNYIPRGTVPDMMHAMAAPTFVPPSRFRPDISPELDRVIERALQPNRQDRYVSAGAFLAALRDAVPPAMAAGGMAQLLEELLGDARPFRAQELERLLRTPNPEDFETRPTKVYVVREGIVPLEQVRTETRPSVGPTAEATALTEVSSRSGSIKIHPVSNVSQTPRHLATHRVETRRGISVPVLIAAVLAAAVIGGLIAVFVVLAVLERSPPAPAPLAEQAIPRVAAPPSTPSVTVRTPAPAPAESAPAPLAPKRRAPPARRAPAKVAKAAPAMPTPALSPEATLEAALDRVEAKARAARNTAATPEAKAAATKILLDIAQWRPVKDLDRKQAAVRALQARVSAL